MKDWSLAASDPLFLNLAADARLSVPDYVNDHIWQLEIGSGEPAALSLYTTFGLRARSMRIFPRFTESGKAVSNPSEFVEPVTIHQVYPNFMLIEFSPFEGINVVYELRVPESNVVTGRVSISNRTPTARNLKLEICVALIPLEGLAMTHTQLQMVNTIVGQTSGLFPTMFMTGGPQPGPGPQPSLLVDMNLEPHETRQLTWAQASAETHQESFNLARLISAQPWDAERARIELVNAAGMIEIHTTDPNWDATLAFSQIAARGLFFRANGKLPHASFVQTRQPDQGFSRKGDGSDYPNSWAGQAPLDTYYLSSLLPSSPQLIQDLMQNFLATQTEDGSVDGRPGLGGQRGRHLAMPILASLTWKLYQTSEDEAFLAEVFPKLLTFFWTWFSPVNDRNRDGVPEWGHPLQTGFEDNPFFDTWHPGSQGVDITCVQDPALASLLYSEAQSLILIAQRVDREDAVLLLQRQAEKIKTAVDEAWNSRVAMYRYRDYETGASLAGKILARRTGPGTIKLKSEFEQPIRLLIEVKTQSPAAKRPHVLISEYVTKGESEIILGNQFRWRSGGMVATTKKVHAKIGRIQIKDIEKTDKIIVRTVDYTSINQTLLLPLWAGIPDEQRAQMLISRTVLDAERFDHPYGLPACPNVSDPETDSVCMGVHLPWNQLVCEGLLAYGFRSEAARLVVHLMTGVIQNLRQKSAFYQYYHAETGQGIGERNTLSGMAPVGLFLDVLGVRLISPTKVRLEGKNPFPWPVVIKYKGLVIKRNYENTDVTFQNGKMVSVTQDDPVIISMS